MKTKVCTKCDKRKVLSKFHKSKNGKFGIVSICKECNKKYRIKHKENISLYNKQWKKQNKEKLQLQAKNYYHRNKNKIKKYRKKYRQKNKEKISKQNNIYYEQHKRLLSFWSNKPENKLKVKLYQCQYKQNNKSIRNKKEKIHRNTDLAYKITINLRTRIRLALKENWKTGKTLDLLGCSVKFLKDYLESKFKPGMSWNNYGTGWYGKGMKEWHIDHIRPCCTFDLGNPSEQRKCFNYANLQPLWAKENLKKSARENG